MKMMKNTITFILGCAVFAAFAPANKLQAMQSQLLATYSGQRDVKVMHLIDDINKELKKLNMNKYTIQTHPTLSTGDYRLVEGIFNSKFMDKQGRGTQDYAKKVYQAAFTIATIAGEKNQQHGTTWIMILIETGDFLAKNPAQVVVPAVDGKEEKKDEKKDEKLDEGKSALQLKYEKFDFDAYLVECKDLNGVIEVSTKFYAPGEFGVSIASIKNHEEYAVLFGLTTKFFALFFAKYKALFQKGDQNFEHAISIIRTHTNKINEWLSKAFIRVNGKKDGFNPQVLTIADDFFSPIAPKKPEVAKKEEKKQVVVASPSLLSQLRSGTINYVAKPAAAALLGAFVGNYGPAQFEPQLALDENSQERMFWTMVGAVGLTGTYVAYKLFGKKPAAK